MHLLYCNLQFGGNKEQQQQLRRKSHKAERRIRTKGIELNLEYSTACAWGLSCTN